MEGMTDGPPTCSIGILYPGDLGAAFGQVLARRGFAVFTALRGRSAATRERAGKAGIFDVVDLDCLLTKVDFLLSFVPPGAARMVAGTVAAQASPQGRPALVDFNSIAPDVAEDIAQLLNSSGIDYIDGAVHGQPSQLETAGAVYLSGPRSHELVELLRGVLRVYTLGTDVSSASRFKMLLAAVSKCMVSTFLQAGIVARQADQLKFFLEQARSFYPGLMEAIDRMAPTYPRHVGRRIDELMDVERTISQQGLRPGAPAETRRFLEEMARAGLPSGPDAAGWSVENLIEALAAAGVLGNTTPKSP